MKVKIWLTQRQAQVYQMYVKEGMNQKEIAIKLYGSKYRQGDVSKILGSVSAKLGIDLGKQFNKTKKTKFLEFEIDLDIPEKREGGKL
jgi:hypothetical protein|tara:strand:+ start:480 stop:743 length:264 start_codon:yes stop_codon:yes gene_type:complete